MILGCFYDDRIAIAHSESGCALQVYLGFSVKDEPEPG